MRGTIALDIDGTVTAEAHSIPAEVIQFLAEQAAAGWHIFFVTGRSYIWAHRALENLPFSFSFAVQNGATLLAMPNKEVLADQALDRSILPAMERICAGEESDFVVYGGYAAEDRCYYRPAHFSKDMRAYVEERVIALKEHWIPLDSFNELPLQTFSSVKCFGRLEMAARLTERIETELSLHVPLIKDPFNREMYVVLATHPNVNKGAALQTVLALKRGERPVIAAGDDLNDIPLLQAADIKIAMSTAPETLLKSATLIAPPAEEKGIIQGLKRALNILGEKL